MVFNSRAYVMANVPKAISNALKAYDKVSEAYADKEGKPLGEIGIRDPKVGLITFTDGKLYLSCAYNLVKKEISMERPIGVGTYEGFHIWYPRLKLLEACTEELLSSATDTAIKSIDVGVRYTTGSNGLVISAAAIVDIMEPYIRKVCQGIVKRGDGAEMDKALDSEVISLINSLALEMIKVDPGALRDELRIIIGEMSGKIDIGSCDMEMEEVSISRKRGDKKYGKEDGQWGKRVPPLNPPRYVDVESLV